MAASTTDPREVVRALFDPAHQAGDSLSLDHVDALMAADFVNHAAAPQGREGWKRVVTMIEADLGPVTIEEHHVVVEGDLVAQHLTLHGTHRGSSMPLLAGRPVTGRPVRWRFIHLWRVVGGRIVEHWATRDDLELLGQLDLEATHPGRGLPRDSR